MKFTAQKIDLGLELTKLDGVEEPLISPKITLFTASEVARIRGVWETIEKEEDNKKKPLKVMADQLALIYPKKSEWFMNNFDVKTLNDIVIYVAQTMGGIVKNEGSSN